MTFIFQKPNGSKFETGIETIDIPEHGKSYSGSVIIMSRRQKVLQMQFTDPGKIIKTTTTKSSERKVVLEVAPAKYNRLFFSNDRTRPFHLS